MKFAEMTQEVQTVRPTAPKLEFGLTPGRRQANEVLLNSCDIRLKNLSWHFFTE